MLTETSDVSSSLNWLLRQNQQSETGLGLFAGLAATISFRNCGHPKNNFAGLITVVASVLEQMLTAVKAIVIVQKLRKLKCDTRVLLQLLILLRRKQRGRPFLLRTRKVRMTLQSLADYETVASSIELVPNST